MSSPLPERPPIHAAPATGQAALSDAVIEAAIANAIEQAKRHGTSPQAVIGTTPPVAQPGIPPMDPHYTQLGRLCLYIGCATVPPGLVGSLFMVATGYADPTVLAWCAVGVASLAVLVIAVGKAGKRIMSAAPPPAIHEHYTGTVYQDQRNVHTSTKGVWAKTNNQQ